MLNSRKFLILSIDDDPALAELLERSSKVGFPEARFTFIRSIGTLTEYLQKPNLQLPHIILLDLNMPEADAGFSLLTKLRNESPTSLIPIIVLTASDNNLHIDEAYFKGANAYMTKPETYRDWIDFMASLKSFWQQTVTLPRAGIYSSL
ncbi:response regulator [Spirosoma sp.]|uniref:response regulator n=1 Tax=Spirosoma sp. TaxID=1899569 RepID=UPI003B3B61C6